jgi:hypothetical protein
MLNFDSQDTFMVFPLNLLLESLKEKNSEHFMKKFLYFLLSLFLVSCANLSNRGDSNVIIRTPAAIYPITKSIIGNGGTMIPADSLSQSRFRYEVIVESSGKRIVYAQLSNDTEKTISVPSGIPLNFQIGVYYAKDGRTMDEQYNVYLASCSKNNVTIMSGESKNLELKLDLNKQQKVDSYFDTAIFDGINSVTGGVIGSDGTGIAYPCFTIDLSRVRTSRFFKYSVGTLSTFASSFTLNSIYKVFYSPNDINGEVFWIIGSSSNNIQKSILTENAAASILTTSIPNPTVVIPSISTLSTSHFMVSLNTYNYHFLNYGNGFINFWSSITGAPAASTKTWATNAHNFDFSDYSYIYPYEPFLLDVEQLNSLLVFLATKNGLYLVDKTSMDLLASGDRNSLLANFKKYIRIPNSSGNLLITKVKVAGTDVYLGTRQGLYKIDRTSSAWSDFLNAPSSDFVTLSPGAITKVEEFIFNEPVESIDIVDLGNSDYVAAISTPKRVWFKHITNGKTDMVTVWNGLPFVPNVNCPNTPQLKSIDYKIHDSAPVSVVLWDSLNTKFWIGTNYGLCSIDYNKLNL